MRRTRSNVSGFRRFTGPAVGLIMGLWIVANLFAEPPASAVQKNDARNAKKAEDSKRISIDKARDRAKLTHNIYAATLDVMHERYFRADRSTVPARAMQDVFGEIAKKENIKANWISVNSRAMSIDHTPKTDFEKRAAKELAGGKESFERIEDGVYRRAERISLMNRGCLGCHLGFGDNTTTKRFAGLVISIPVSKAKTANRK